MNNEAKPFRCFGYVDVRDKKERQVFIEYLEKHGFKCDEDEVTTRQSTIDSRFSITVDTYHKKYGHLHNVTCSAAAATSARLVSTAEFYEHFPLC